MKKRTACLVGFIAISLGSSSLSTRAQDLEPLPMVPELGALTVGGVISSVEDAVNDLIEEAFSRLDRSVLLAAQEARATLNGAAVLLVDVERTLISDLDDQQRRIVEDLLTLERAIDESLGRRTEEIDRIVRGVLSDINLVLSNNPGFIRIIPSFALHNDEVLDVAIRGTALSNMEFQDFHVNDVPYDPEFVQQDDLEVSLRIPLNTGPARDLLEESQGRLAELPIDFSVEQCKWWGLVCSTRRFSQVAQILPNNIGTVRAVWSGEVLSEERREKNVGPYNSSRVKSRVRLWKGVVLGRRSDIWTARPDEGWVIDLDSVSVDFRLLRSGCSGRRAGWSWEELDAQILRVRARTISERKFHSTCITRTTIKFTQLRPTEIPMQLYSKDLSIQANQRTVISLVDEGRRLRNARLGHVEIASNLHPDRTIIVRPQETRSGFSVSYASGSQTAYLDVRYFE